jgi:EAL domain-containing protein (putative c-di-GMP-specific phosphodiesterase class I)
MMPTELMHDSAAATAWLEYYGPDSSAPERTPLATFPFTLGRNESADLHVDSGRVSREHAVIMCDRNTFTVRDLNSTNGTFLNGKRIQEARLADGDLLSVADIEFSFCCGKNNATRKTVTQVMSSDRETTADGDEADAAADAVCEVRRLHERLLHCAVEIAFAPIVSLVDESPLGYEAVAGQEGSAVMQTECRLSSRIRAVERLIAVEQATRLGSAAHLFLPLGAADVDGVSAARSLERLAQLLGDPRRLTVQIPDSAACDIPFFRDFLALTRELGVAVAYDGFTSGAAQLGRQRDIAPDFVKLAPSLARGVSRNRNLRRSLRDIVRAAEEVGAEVVAAGVDGSESAGICRELGCRYAQGAFIGAPLPIDELPGVEAVRRR